MLIRAAFPQVTVVSESWNPHGCHHLEHGSEPFVLTPDEYQPPLFTAVNDEIPPGPPDISKVVRVLKQNGILVSA